MPSILDVSRDKGFQSLPAEVDHSVILYDELCKGWKKDEITPKPVKHSRRWSDD